MTCRSPLDICSLRLTRLESDGTPDFASSTGALVLAPDQVSSLKWTAQYASTQEVAEFGGCGGLAIVVPPEDLLKWYDVEIDAVVESDQLHELAYGASLLLDGDDAVIGHAVLLDTACGTPSLRNGVCVEGWSKNWLCDEADPDAPLRRVAFSKVKFTPGDGTRQRGPNHLILKGRTFANSSLGDGPFHDFPDGLPDKWAKAEFNDTDLPDADADCGYVTTPAAS